MATESLILPVLSDERLSDWQAASRKPGCGEGHSQLYFPTVFLLFCGRRKKTPAELCQFCDIGKQPMPFGLDRDLYCYLQYRAAR
jgi:hypothetical protein